MTGGWQGGPVTTRAACVLAGNPGPMTLDGTNTWVLSEPGSNGCAVVDPGPLDEAHLRRVLDVVAARGTRVEQVLLPHHHLDHAESAQHFGELTGAPVRALGDGLRDGDRLQVGGLELSVVATPGHTADSLSFLLPEDNALLTGDTVLGRGTTVVSHPEGRLAAYLDSLERIAAMTNSGQVETILPGHGPTVQHAAQAVWYYLEHRRERLGQVRAALADGAGDADAVVARVYADVPEELRPAARLSVLAQLDYLRAKGLSGRGA
jgi:glyoxylase-like metal-dependent hydrolase (beta-lactamase superfamily II)